jgi:fumarate reductase flavoprotein subunit
MTERVANDEWIRWEDEAGDVDWDVEVDVLVVGAGACGMIAAVAAAQNGARSVMILEKEPEAGGNTALSQGMIPAAGSRVQKEAGIDDDPERMAADILAKNHHQGDPELTRWIAGESGRLVDWLTDDLGIRLRLVTDFLYPGHSNYRIHAPATTKGAFLVNALLGVIGGDDRIDVAYGAPARRLIARRDGGDVLGAEVDIEGVGRNSARARKTILALNGFGANRDMVARYIPEMADAYYFGHEGNTGEGIRWGRALGAELVHMTAYQGHGSVAHPHGTLVTWAVITLGGYQVNADGRRFVNEDHGYSEHAMDVLRQPGGTAVEIFDQPIYDVVAEYEDFRKCVEMGAIRRFDSIEALAGGFQIDPDALRRTHQAFVDAAAGRSPDEMGRANLARPPRPPLYGVRVTGALLHTQGGLRVDRQARVLRPDGSVIENLYAGGGTAVGFSGKEAQGYLSANGLLAATTLGKLAGTDAGRAVGEGSS